ncbi:RBBP9/YdeN family alpha/beta hydrolase [Candidatus Sulfurimonas baltica]|uniref:Alpha/beta hydrolase n=1 Tax=Candidatus Sulfurimonas baltica TaxID=2740404 RepID=A0A7S7RNA7_9BACT|nr:alpha/beta hydrolase [Candidatus Sulfurimonas baltica]QOY52245.1 alpha/beta hydrolase [Candidatus Sulfurimonas baltica]
MSKKVLLLHGWGGSDFPHWQSWLAGEIAKEYGKVSFLKFSNIDFPNKNDWENELKTELEDFKPDIVICHSIANILWFHICNNLHVEKIEKLYMVAPPSLKCNIEELKSFFPCKIPTNLNAKESLLITSTNDPYLTQDEAKALQADLGIPMKVLDGAGHINAESGFGEWSWMLEELRK